MQKIVTFTKRVTGTELDHFHRLVLQAARERPMPAGCSRLAHSQTLPQGYRHGELLYDAMDEFWFERDQDAAIFRRSLAQEGPQEPDSRHPRVVRMRVDVHLQKAGDIPPGALKNVEFVNRRPDMALGPFRDYWRTFHGPLASGIPQIIRYEQHHCADGEYAGGDPPFDGLALTWFDSTASMRASAGHPVYLATREDEPNFLAPGHLPFIITRELMDRGTDRPAGASGNSV